MKDHRLISTRKYYLASGSRFFSFKCRDNEKSLLIDLENSGGTISITLVDLITSKETKYENPETGIIEIPLETKHKYRLRLTYSKTCGSYNIRIKK